MQLGVLELLALPDSVAAPSLALLAKKESSKPNWLCLMPVLSLMPILRQELQMQPKSCLFLREVWDFLALDSKLCRQR